MKVTQYETFNYFYGFVILDRVFSRFTTVFDSTSHAGQGWTLGPLIINDLCGPQNRTISPARRHHREQDAGERGQQTSNCSYRARRGCTATRHIQSRSQEKRHQARLERSSRDTIGQQPERLAVQTTYKGRVFFLLTITCYCRNSPLPTFIAQACWTRTV